MKKIGFVVLLLISLSAWAIDDDGQFMTRIEPKLAVGCYRIRAQLAMSQSGDFLFVFQRGSRVQKELIIVNPNPLELIALKDTAQNALVEVSEAIRGNNHPFVRLVRIEAPKLGRTKEDIQLVESNLCESKSGAL